MGKQLKFWFLAALTTLVVLAGSILQIGEPLMAAPLNAANHDNSAISHQLYTQYPNIPRTEQANTTLLSRFIDYHLQTKARPAQYHFDWELSIAEYLDTANHTDTSAIAATDRAAMQTLSRQQRHALVRSLETLFAQ